MTLPRQKPAARREMVYGNRLSTDDRSERGAAAGSSSLFTLPRRLASSITWFSVTRQGFEP